MHKFLCSVSSAVKQRDKRVRKRSRKGRRSGGGGRQISVTEPLGPYSPSLFLRGSPLLTASLLSWKDQTVMLVLLPVMQDATFCYASINFCRTFP